MDTTLARGRLLVATPGLVDPNFAGTVVLLLEHNDDGSLGVVLNRPTTVAVTDTLPHLAAAEPAVVFSGGPVQPEAVLGLIRTDDITADTHTVLAGVRLADLAAPLPDTARALRLFAGYAGWAAGQARAEVDAGGWLVVDAQPDDAFCARPQDLWRAVLRRQGGLFVSATRSPRLN